MYTQQTFTQLKQAAFNLLLLEPLKQFYKRAFYMGNILAFFVYASVRLMLHDFPFEILEETFFIIRILLAGWCLAGLCIGGFTLLMFIADNTGLIVRKVLQRAITFYNYSRKTICTENLMPGKQPAMESINM